MTIKKPNPEPKEVLSDVIKDNDTWNRCPHCGMEWKNSESIPGVIYRTKSCLKCERERIYAGNG